jgi:hypothetical protein
MALSWFSLVIDCEHPASLADFWCAALDFQVVYRSDDIIDIAADSESYPGIEFIRSESHDDRKSPLHIDLDPDDQADEVARLVALGARRVDVGQPDDANWVVLADPEGNAFCVLAPQTSWEAGPA